MFTHKEIELLQRVVYEAYRNTKKRKDFVEETLDEGEERLCDVMTEISNNI